MIWGYTAVRAAVIEISDIFSTDQNPQFIVKFSWNICTCLLKSSFNSALFTTVTVLVWMNRFSTSSSTSSGDNSNVQLKWCTGRCFGSFNSLHHLKLISILVWELDNTKPHISLDAHSWCTCFCYLHCAIECIFLFVYSNICKLILTLLFLFENVSILNACSRRSKRSTPPALVALFSARSIPSPLDNQQTKWLITILTCI